MKDQKGSKGLPDKRALMLILRGRRKVGAEQQTQEWQAVTPDAQLDAAQRRFVRVVSDVMMQWRQRFSHLENRSFVQTHAAFDELAVYFDLDAVGALTTHHEVTIGFREAMRVKKRIQQEKTRCVVAVPDEEIATPAHWFSPSPVVREIDPLGRQFWRQANLPDDKVLRSYTAFLSDILSAFEACFLDAQG